MIDYDEEIKKYKPMVELKQAEKAIVSSDLTDMVDILKELTESLSKSGDSFQ